MNAFATTKERSINQIEYFCYGFCIKLEKLKIKYEKSVNVKKDEKHHSEAKRTNWCELLKHESGSGGK